MGIVLAVIAVLAVGVTAWHLRGAWGDQFALATAVTGLAVTVLVPLGSIPTLVGCVWLYHRASTEQVARLARSDDLDAAAQLQPKAPGWAGLFWGGCVVLIAGSIAAATFFGLPTERLDDGTGLATFAGDEGLEHAVPDSLIEDPGGLHEDAPGGEELEDHPGVDEEGYLYIEDERGEVPVAEDKAIFDALAEAITTDDETSIAAMVDDDTAFVVDSDSSIEVVDTRGPASHIEVLDGEQHNASGWVPVQWTHEQPRD